MTKKKIRVISLFLLIACMMTIPVNAQEIVPYASDQIDSYDGNVVVCANGKLAIEFSIQGTAIMKKIGSSRIVIYERYGTDGWMIADVFTEQDTGMTASGKNSYGTTMYYNGVVGTEYKVKITLFATDYNNVTDSRTVTCYT